MNYIPTDSETVGLCLEGETLKVAFVSSKGQEALIQKLFEVEPSPDVNPLYISEEKALLEKLAKEHLTVSTIASKDLLVRRLYLKITNEKDLEEAYPFQAETALPYPLEESVLNKIITDKDEEGTEITFFATKKEKVNSHLNFYLNTNIDPEAITGEPIALMAFAEFFTEKKEALFIVHVTKERAISTLLKKGKVISSFELTTGWGIILDELSDQNDHIPISLDEFLSHGDLDKLSSFQNLLQKIQWNYLAQVKETKLKETPSLLILGTGILLTHFEEALQKKLNLEMVPLKASLTYSEDEIKIYALPIGTALCFQPTFSTKLSFRKEELSYKTPWKRYQTPFLLYALASLFFAFSLFLFGNIYLSQSENSLRQEYLNLLSFTNKDYNLIENKYSLKSYGETPKEIETLTPDDLENRLNFLDKELTLTPETFPLYPLVPNVTEVLTWLTHHPGINEGSDEISNPPFLIDNFTYTLVKRPEINKKTEKYQVKVEFEFETSSPKIAREFHDALIAPNDFVDPKTEVKWNASKGKYKTSFFLKDKTTYLK